MGQRSTVRSCSPTAKQSSTTAFPSGWSSSAAAPIGVEFGYVYNAYGSTVTIVEGMPRILPQEDEEVSQALARALTKLGMKVLAGSTVTKVTVGGAIAEVEIDTPDGKLSFSADRVLVAVGIRPNTEGLGAENAGAALDRGFVQVDDNLSANGGSLYAIGDVNGRLPLAHVAQAEGVFVAERIAGLDPQPLDYLAMPRAAYCSPQVASMGLTEAEARDQGLRGEDWEIPLPRQRQVLGCRT